MLYKNVLKKYVKKEVKKFAKKIYRKQGQTAHKTATEIVVIKRRDILAEDKKEVENNTESLTRGIKEKERWYILRR